MLPKEVGIVFKAGDYRERQSQNVLTVGTEGGKLRGHGRGKTQEDSAQELFAREPAMQETVHIALCHWTRELSPCSLVAISLSSAH